MRYSSLAKAYGFGLLGFELFEPGALHLERKTPPELSKRELEHDPAAYALSDLLQDPMQS